MKNILFIASFLFIVSNVVGQSNINKREDLLNYSDINGLKQGAWKKTYSNGVIEYEAYFIDGKPIGDFKRYDKLGNLFAYLIHDTTTNFARAEFYHRNGKLMSKGNYRGKNQDSTWNYYSDNGILYLQESYKQGIPNGVFRRYTRENILVEEIYWRDSVKHGLWKKFYITGGIMSELHYNNGILDGESKVWHKNGNVSREGAFKKGLMEGAWFKYNKEGNLEKVYNYKHGYSQEAEEEDNEFMRELQNNKGKIEGPQNSNDIDWLRGRSRY